MKFKKFSLILPLLYLNLKALCVPLTTESTDIYFESESDDEVINVDINEDDIKTVDIFSEDEDIPTTFITNEECLTEECIENSKRILSNMDTSIDPCEDFYQFSCGGWVSEKKTKEINYENPPEINSEVKEKLYTTLNDIFEGEYKVDNSLTKEEQEMDEFIFNKIKHIYDICMKFENNSDSKNEVVKHFINSLNITENLKDPKELTKLILQLVKVGINPLFAMDLENEEDENRIYMEYSYGSVFSEYFELSEKTPEIDSTYKDYIIKTLNNFYGNDPNNELMAEKIFKFVKKIYNINYDFDNKPKEIPSEIPSEETEEPDYIVINIESLNENYPFMDWKMYFNELFEFYEINDVVLDEVFFIISHGRFLNYYNELNKVFNESDVDSIIAYIKWIVITSDIFNDFISEDLVNLKINTLNHFIELDDEYGEKYDDTDDMDDMDDMNYLKKRTVNNNRKRLNKNKLNDRNKNIYNFSDMIIEGYSSCLSLIDELVPMSIPRYFIKRTFDDNFKQRADQMVYYIKESMVERISNIEWLDEETKQNGIEKVKRMKNRIGYTEEYMDIERVYRKYEKLEINDFLDIILNIYSTEEKIKFRDDDPLPQWQYYLLTLNAGYLKSENAMEFPIAIFLPPYYTNNELDYLNYGAIGSIIGHELTHAFDSSNKNVDAFGDENDWWTDNDNEDFNQLSQCFIDQYNLYTYNVANKSYHVDGKETLGENISDNGGVARAFEAWQKLILNNQKGAPEYNKKLPGLSNYTLEQLFYIAFAQSHCSIESYDTLDDVHSPGYARVNGVVSNSNHFAKTFNCPPKSPMNPETKCVIW